MPRKTKQVEHCIPMQPGEGNAVGDTQEFEVSVAAYYRAEARGFAPGLELDDWLAAEEEFAGRDVGG